MSSPYLEAAAMAERERDEALDQLAGVIRQRDDLKRQLVAAIDENLQIREELKRYQQERKSA